MTIADWEIGLLNEEKLGCTLKQLSKRITTQGMQFGIWIEPEGISEDSDLYRTHPEWAVQIPQRKPCLSRNQLILDFSRKDVQDYMIQTISDLIVQKPLLAISNGILTELFVINSATYYLQKDKENFLTNMY